MGRDQQRVSMLERGVQVLQAFRPRGGTLTLTALVERTGERIGTAGPANAIRVVSLTLARTLAGRSAG